MSPSSATPLQRLLAALNPASLVVNLCRHRHLIAQFTRREVQGRYQGNYLGILWSILTPLTMLAIYTFIFGVVFKARWPQAHGGDTLQGFALVMFAGQLAFQMVAEPVGRAAGTITGVPNFVKKVVFPLEILPVVQVLSGLFHVAMGMLVLVIADLALYGSTPWTVCLVPILALPMILLALGLSWFLSSLGVYVRDIGNFVGLALNVLIFATPIFYPITALPEQYRHLLYLNPLTPGVELIRSALITGDLPGLHLWLVAMVIGAVIAVLGHAWFVLTKHGFADVL